MHAFYLKHKELVYGDWHGIYVPFSSVDSKFFATVGSNQ
jgi:hypothetical protein